MHITLETEGGLAHFPGLAKPTTIEGTDLPQAMQSALEQLAEKPASAAASAKARRPDGFVHHLTIEIAGRTRTLTMAEPIDDPVLREVVSAVRAAIRAKRDAR